MGSLSSVDHPFIGAALAGRALAPWPEIDVCVSVSVSHVEVRPPAVSNCMLLYPLLCFASIVMQFSVLRQLFLTTFTKFKAILFAVKWI